MAKNRKGNIDESRHPESESEPDSDVGEYINNGGHGMLRQEESSPMLEKRTKKAQKRLKQHNQYNILIEDRILALETEVAILNNGPTPAQVEDAAKQVHS